MEKNGNEETKNNDTALNVAQKTRGTAPAGRAWDPVCGAFAGGPCLCGGRLGVENAASGAVWPVWLRQFCAGCSGVLPGRAVHAGRGSAAPHLQAGAGARVCKRHGDRVFRHPAAGAVGLPDGGGLLPERLSGVAVRRRTGCGAGRQPAAALRPAGGKLHHAGAGALRQPVHF